MSPLQKEAALWFGAAALVVVAALAWLVATGPSLDDLAHRYNVL
jgi:hypothetical protein